jgi:hypothetical protein
MEICPGHAGTEFCFEIGQCAMSKIMKGKNLTWDEIKKLYDQEWVQLVDYDWPDGELYPRSGVLRTHGSNKKEFHQQCRRKPVPDDSAILFIGPPRTAENLVFSSNLT